MFERSSAYLLPVYCLLSIGKVISSEHLLDAGVYVHCTQTATDRLDSTPKTIIPEQTNALEIPQIISESSHVMLSLCPDRRFLKISWPLSHTKVRNLTMCYRMDSIQSKMVMGTVCFHLRVYQSNLPSAMNCWFPMEYINKQPIITAWVQQSLTTSRWSLSGSLNTSALDPVNSCSDVCEVVQMHIASLINCQDNASIVYNISTVVKHLSFDAIGNTSCKNDIIRISRQTDSRLDYHLACGYSGLGYVKVLFYTQGKYCLKCQLVKVYCPNGSYTSAVTAVSEAGNIHSFGTFVVFGIICTVVITAMFFSIIFAAQGLMYLKITYFKSHRESLTSGYRGSRNPSLNGEDSIPLNTNISETQEEIKRNRSLNRQDFDVPDLSRKPTRRRFSSTTFSSLPENTTEGKARIPTMRKSVTMALLEETDPFYKKKILFLPKPFDNFTHDVTKILKTLFENDIGVLSQCCYDRSVYKHFMTSDRTKWIENVLGDHDKILIFLCFTSLDTPCVDGKYETMVEEILDHLVWSNVKSPRLCKVVFLYLTDKSEHVQKKHYGDIFHISNTYSYQKFLCDILNFCGRNADQYPDLFYKILNCRASNAFLRYIGIQGRRDDNDIKNHNSPPCRRHSSRRK